MRRSSFGGMAVAMTLETLGFQATDKWTTLVETGPPRNYRVCLVQNAWNLIPDDEFQRRIEPYPLRMAVRIRARRHLAAYNIKRAQQVVTLTEACAELVTQRFGRGVTVAPVTRPLANSRLSIDVATPITEPNGSFILVPGTVTWYRAPMDAAAIAYERNVSSKNILFYGPADNSGAWRATEVASSALGYQTERVEGSHQLLRALYACAETVILPSRLESLGFPLAEALSAGARRVIARALPAHLEIACRVGGASPEWLENASDSQIASREMPTRVLSDADVVQQWVNLAVVLNYNRGPVKHTG